MSEGNASPPGIAESLRGIGGAGKATFETARETGRALRILVSSDLALARSALGRALAWVGVAIVFGASAWLLSTAALIALLQYFGWSWLASLSLAAVVSLAVTALAAWRVSHYFDHAGMHATRRQLARLGIGDEPADEHEGLDDDDDPPAPAPAAAAPPPAAGPTAPPGDPR